MAVFLTDEWIEMALAIYETAGEAPPEINTIGAALCLRVTKMPPDMQTEDFYIILDEGVVIDLGRGTPPVKADATIEGDFETAKGLVVGGVSAEKALTSGKVRVEGDMGKLVAFASQQGHPTAIDIARRIRESTE